MESNKADWLIFILLIAVAIFTTSQNFLYVFYIYDLSKLVISNKADWLVFIFLIVVAIFTTSQNFSYVFYIYD